MSVNNILVPNPYEIYINKCIPYEYSGIDLDFLAPVNTIYNLGKIPSGKKFIIDSLIIFILNQTLDLSNDVSIVIGSSSLSYVNLCSGFDIPSNQPSDTYLANPVSEISPSVSCPSGDLIGVQINTAATGTTFRCNIYIKGYLV